VTLAVALCACGRPRRRGFSACDACREAQLLRRGFVRVADSLDHALLYQLRTRNRACDCRCPAADHDDRGCRWCGSRCTVPYAEHGDREAHEQLDAWLGRGGALAAWVWGWRREEPPADQARPAAVSGEIGC
jgi:hypothetical protein